MRIWLLLLFLFAQVSLQADPFEELLKSDWNQSQTLLIKNSVFQRLGRRANEKDVLKITKNVIPWAILEGVTPEKTADLIVNLDYAVRQGLTFEEAEDAIPVMSKRDLSKEDFSYIGLYFKETKKAFIREEVRNRFVEAALEKNWDGLSILAGGRALIAGKLVDFPQNRLATKVLSSLPAKGRTVPFDKLEAGFKNSLDSKLEGGSYILLSNLKKLHAGEKASEPKNLGNARAIDSSLDEVGGIVIGERPKFEPLPDAPLVPNLPEPGESSDYDKPTKEGWETLSASSLRKVAGEWVGTPYKWANAAKTGTDCSGFTYRVLTDGRIGVPEKMVSRASSAQTKMGTGVTHEEMRAGDLIFFSASPNQSKVTHVGMVLSKEEFAHASSSRGVVIDKIAMKWWIDRFVLSRRVFKKVID
ncbi:NlpC/P60 family protein [Leptospira langatensis]|uniref:NlpC/P60 family protein n=1 Tax=Leptospira langatensis TaxID=2484983 RepID=A0A5F2A074_9LEPT|nr:C40 family peptidase [Leptospira langatensis]TGK04233.1 NlpC/P60 family protein [Leptospira langatensis]TGL43713.1 NlpC/P60 family protein [Leptospira langatensis]